MNTLQKIMSCLLVVSTLFALTACGSNGTTSQTRSAGQSQESSAAESSIPAETAAISCTSGIPFGGELWLGRWIPL